MMPKVIIKGQSSRDLGRKIKLTNGNLVVYKDRNEVVIGTYIVTSFRNSSKSDKWEDTTNYCSLINLSNGTISFKEPSSRYSTEGRLLKHLTSFNNTDSDFSGRSITIYDNDSYRIEITLNESEVE